MNITNAQYTEDGNITALVDGVQMNIPANAGNRHYAAMLEQGITPAEYVEPVPTLEEIRTKTRTPRAKFAIAAAKAGLITEAEAEEWAAGAANPQWVSDAIEAAVAAGTIPEDERLAVRISVRTQDTIGRTDRLIPILADNADLTPEQVDALFGIDV